MIDISYKISKELTREVHDHEIFISFNSDEGAYSFQDWWHVEGEKLFQGWIRDQEKLAGKTG